MKPYPHPAIASRYRPPRAGSSLAARSVAARHAPVSSAIAPSALEIIFAVVAGLVALLGHLSGTPLVSTTNLLVPVILIVAQCIGIYTIINRTFQNIWAPMIWIRIAFIFYFGLGSLIPGFLNDETLNIMESFYFFFPEDAGKYNLVNCVFLLCLLLASLAVSRLAGQAEATQRFAFQPSAWDARTMGLGLILIGLIAYYGSVFPAVMGYEGATTSLFAAQIAFGVYLGIFLLGTWALEHRSPWIFFVIAVTLLQFVSGSLILSKYEAILPLVMLGIAYIYHKRSAALALAIGAAIYVVYIGMADVLSYGRTQAGSVNGRFASTSVAERVNILLSYGQQARYGDYDEIQGGWARLSYINGATFAINQYDAGMPGNSLEHLPIIWLPRIIYPSKPNVTDKGFEFNFAVNGSDTSASTPAIPAEGYWNLGWTGVVVFGASIGAILTLWSIYSLAVIQSSAWHLFFIVLLGMRVGVRIDGMYVADIIGPIGYAVLGHIALQMLNRLIIRSRGGPRAPALA